MIGDAERLVPQPGSDAAANALLKALEEPPVETVFVLTSAAVEALPPTIVSRVVRVRMARLADSIVAAFAQQELGIHAQAELRQRVGLVDGCPGRLLAETDRKSPLWTTGRLFREDHEAKVGVKTLPGKI